MKNHQNKILLDLDGVLITTPSWKPDNLHEDGYSDFNREAVQNLNILLSEVDAELWLSSTRRLGKTLEEFNLIFSNRNIQQSIKGFLPAGTLGENRLIEVEAFLDHEFPKNFLILDDDTSLNELEDYRKKFWVKTDRLIGFNEEKLREALVLVNQWT